MTDSIVELLKKSIIDTCADLGISLDKPYRPNHIDYIIDRMAERVTEDLAAQNLSIEPGWRDISTAPKDGTEIDIMLNGVGRVTGVKWDETDCFTENYETWLDSYLLQPVVFPDDHINEITHWLAIKPITPPKQEGGK